MVLYLTSNLSTTGSPSHTEIWIVLHGKTYHIAISQLIQFCQHGKESLQEKPVLYILVSSIMKSAPHILLVTTVGTVSSPFDAL